MRLGIVGIACAAAAVALGHARPAHACGPSPRDLEQTACPLFQFSFTDREVPLNATFSLSVAVRRPADIKTLRMIRTSDGTEQPFDLGPPATPGSDPVGYKIVAPDLAPGEYALEGADSCRRDPRIGAFRVTETAPLPTRLGTLVTTVRPTQDVKVQEGVGGDCKPILRTGRTTSVTFTATLDPAVMPWRDVTSIAVELDGTTARSGSPVRPPGATPSSTYAITAEVFCSGDEQLRTSRAWLTPGRHTGRMVAFVDDQRAGGGELVVTDTQTFDAPCSGDADDDGGCATAPREGPRDVAGVLLVAAALLVRRFRRGGSAPRPSEDERRGR